MATSDITDVSAAAETVTKPTDPRRVRLGPKVGAVDQILGTYGLLQPLRATNGLVWPYQPTINWTQGINYSSQEMLHTNQEFKSYTRSSAATFSVDGMFSIQNQTDGLYSLACIHFLRTVSKMAFGASQNPGTPPPVLQFSAYGTMMFNKLPVILERFAVSLPNDVDYVPIDLANVSWDDSTSSTDRTPSLNQDLNSIQTLLRGGTNLTSSAGYVWLPSVFNISVDLTVQNTPNRLRQFDLDQFRTGSLLKKGRWT